MFTWDWISTYDLREITPKNVRGAFTAANQLLFLVCCKLLVCSSFQSHQDGWQRLVKKKSLKLLYSALEERPQIFLWNLLTYKITRRPSRTTHELEFLTYFSENMLTHSQ
ncbi:hypothetical protein CICLE_v10003267mg [Citrus x clementina]|uniref:Uncharacterized protein n=1 Tax=Citrus clementina TaxID=85681 RepID=V4T4V1_CITCL|nr:hypothetical protein CICLE_v10003267mg [Citrus x clementina]